MSIFENIVLSSFDMVMLVTIIFTLKKEKGGIKDLFMAALSVAISGTLVGISGYYIVNVPLGLMMNTLMACILIYALLKRKLSEIIKIYFFCIVLMASVQFFTTIIYKLTMANFAFSFGYGLLAQTTALVAIFFIVRFVPLQSINSYLTDGNKIFSLIMLNLFVVYYVTLLFWYIDVEGFYTSMIGLLVMIIAFLVLNLVIIRNGLRNQVTADRLQIYETYLPIIENIIEQMRSKQHDYHNHLQVFKALLAKKVVVDNIDSYFSEVDSKDVWNTLILFENRVVMALLYSKYMEAKSQNIEIEYSFTHPTFQSAFTDYELVEMFGIMIDNAIEATAKLQQHQMQVSISYEQGMNVVQTRNPSEKLTSSEIQRMFEYSYSTKKEAGRGIGLYKLKKLLQKEKGTITIYYDTHLGAVEVTARFH